MSSQVFDAAKAAALDLLVAGVDAVVAAGVAPVDSADATVLITELETQTRRLRCQQIDLLANVDRRGLHRTDGHASAKAMVGHVANLCNAEACRRASTAKALRDLPVVHEAFGAGRIGGCQVERIAAAHANPRVRSAVIANDEAFAAQAQAVGHRLFALMVTNWVNHLDQDGPRDRNQRCHDNRDFNLHQDFDATWAFTGGCASMQGTEMAEIFDRFYEAETLTDWAQARARLGDAATAADLARTDAQRRCDASLAIFRQAASHHADNGGSQIITNVVIDHATFERLVELFFGSEAQPVEAPTFGDDEDRYRCSTLDGLARLSRSRLALPDRPPQTLGRPRPRRRRRPRRRLYQPRQRGTRLRETQPTQTTPLHRLARPNRNLARPPPRRHRDPLTTHTVARCWSRTGIAGDDPMVASGRALVSRYRSWAMPTSAFPHDVDLPITDRGARS